MSLSQQYDHLRVGRHWSGSPEGTFSAVIDEINCRCWELFRYLLFLTSDLGPQLLSGSSGEQRENLGVTTPDYYFYLNQSGSYTVEDVDDKKEFCDTMVFTALL